MQQRPDVDVVALVPVELVDEGVVVATEPVCPIVVSAGEVVEVQGTAESACPGDCGLEYVAEWLLGAEELVVRGDGTDVVAVVDELYLVRAVHDEVAAAPEESELGQELEGCDVLLEVLVPVLVVW